MARQKPNIDMGSTTKQRDKESFKNFVLEVIKDTFIFEATPTSISLDVPTQTIFTLTLDGYRFVYEDLQVDNAIDYIDVYLYGVKQRKSRFSIKLYNSIGELLTSSQYARGATKIEFVFNESITRVPTDVVASDFNIKGKIAEVE